MITSCVPSGGRSLFVHLWAIVSPWLSLSVRKLVSTADVDQSLAVLKKLAPPSVLPRLYGGSCSLLPTDAQLAIGMDPSTTKLLRLYDGSSSAAYAYAPLSARWLDRMMCPLVPRMGT